MRWGRKNHKIYRDPKVWVIVALLIAAIALITFNSRKEVTFSLEDKCGKFVNLVSHTIGDEDVCRTRCRSQCESIDYELKDAEFIMPDNGCNTCTCSCR